MRPEHSGAGTAAGRRSPARPSLCLITDRRRLTASLGLPATEWRDPLLAQIRGALAGGVDVVQIRERDLQARTLAAFSRDCVRAAGHGGGRVVLNDRLDLAIASGAHGVHLREDGVPPSVARRLMPADGLLGRSVHTAVAATASAGVDYLIAGPVFATSSKPGHAGLGLDGFGAVAAAAPCPVWAIGGVTPLHTFSLLAAGASGLAAIGAFIPEVSEGDLATAVERIAASLRFTFDSPAGLP